MPQLLHASNDPGECLRHCVCYCCRPSTPLQVLLSKYCNGVILACIANINLLAFDPAFKAWYNYMKTLASNKWLLTPCPPALLRHDDSIIAGITPGLQKPGRHFDLHQTGHASMAIDIHTGLDLCWVLLSCPFRQKSAGMHHSKVTKFPQCPSQV